MKKPDYHNIITPDTFTITVKCSHCKSTNCFIGIKDLYVDYDDIIIIDIVCLSCGHVENWY